MSVTSPEGGNKNPRPKRKDFPTDARFQAALKKWQSERSATSPQPLKADELDIDLLGQGPAFIRQLIRDEKEIEEIFIRAQKEGWLDPGNSKGIVLFQNAVMDSTWWREKSDAARRAWALERTNPGEFSDRLDRAKRQIQRIASQEGIGNLTEEDLNSLARDWIYKDWDDPKKRDELSEALASRLEYSDTGGRRGLGGTAGQVAERLQSIAEANGLKLDEGYYLSAAKSILSGLKTEDDFALEIRRQAAGKWPSLSDQIMAGQNVRDLASGYINMIASEFEIDPMTIGLDDPYLLQALGAIGPDGKMAQMSLWDFRTRLRKDPRWLETSKANNEIANIGEDILRMFGVIG